MLCKIHACVDLFRAFSYLHMAWGRTLLAYGSNLTDQYFGLGWGAHAFVSHGCRDGERERERDRCDTMPTLVATVRQELLDLATLSSRCSSFRYPSTGEQHMGGWSTADFPCNQTPYFVCYCFKGKCALTRYVRLRTVIQNLSTAPRHAGVRTC